MRGKPRGHKPALELTQGCFRSSFHLQSSHEPVQIQEQEVRLWLSMGSDRVPSQMGMGKGHMD